MTSDAEALRITWVRQGDWAGSLLFRGQSYAGLMRDTPAWTGVREGTRAFLQAGRATWLVAGGYEAFSEAYLAKVRERPLELLDLAARFEGVMADVDAMRASMDGMPIARLAARYAELDMASQPYSYVFGYGEDSIVGRTLRDALERAGVPVSGSEAVLQELLVAPLDVPTDTQAAQEDLLDIAILGARQGMRARDVRDRLRAHTARFAHITRGEEEALRTVRAHTKPAEERARRTREAERREAAWRERVRTLDLDPEGETLLLGVRRQLGIRTQRRERWMLARRAYGPHLARMAREMRIGADDVDRLTHEELAGALAGASLPDLRARDSAALLAIDGTLHVLTGAAAERLHAHAQRGEAGESNVRELRGLGASPGVVRGKVRVIHGPAEGHKVEKGEVLVTDMTEPDLVTACERSAAIVTDLGGMLCHAAIVSRELGIPSVLGTGQATRALRDGDLVEVDGTAGVVKILRRA